MHILLSAYSCEPEKGSEPGVGWMWCRLLARFGEVTVITRANNRPSIEAASSIPEFSRLHFEYVDLPDWAKKWKRGNKGARVYYLLWQFAALKRARRLVANTSFDLAWHVTIANAWFGSTFCFLPIPFVFGPVSGGVPSCWRPSIVGKRGVLSELARSVAKTLARELNPLARTAWKRAALILTNNEDTRQWLPRRHHERSVVFPNVILELEPRTPEPARDGSCRILYAGYLLPLKGLSLAIRAMTHLPGWEMDLYGEGPDRVRLEDLARSWGVSDRVHFYDWVSRERLFEVMGGEADVFLFPSLHDEVGWVVAEAQTHGLPVVCLDRGGPKSLGATAVELTSLDETARALAAETQKRTPPPPTSWDPASRFEALRLLLESHGLVTSSHEVA